MYLISLLISSFMILTSCGKHTQESKGKQGIGNTTQVSAEALSKDILDENILNLKKYIESGGDVNAELKSGRTLMTEACHWGKLIAIEYLLSQKADPTRKDRNGKSAVDYGEEDVRIKRVLFPELMLELKKSLIKAVLDNNLISFKKVLEEKPPVNFKIYPHELGNDIEVYDGETFLTFCIKTRKENIIRLLAQPKYKLDVNLANDKDESPLRLSRQLNLINIEKILLKLGAKE